ncbi:MAG TPA: DUF6184 family natural product biosynthesis lipoprotein [Polyangiaceae bacterium]
MSSHVVMVALFTVACGAVTSSDLPVATTTTTGGLVNDPGGLEAAQGIRNGPTRIVLGDDAAAQLASTQCTHEDACGNVGQAGMFSTLDVCVEAIGASQRKRFATTECAKGVDPYALDRCLEDMRAEGCDASPTSCANDRLCR